MTNLNDLGEVVSADVLVIGGGIGGLITAIKAKEETPNAEIVVVDKQTIGWAGKAPKGWGALWVMMPGDDLDKFVEYQVREIGFYLNDQELLYAMASETYGAIEQFVRWGVKVMTNTDGKLDAVKIFSTIWSQVGADIDMLLPLRARARKLGVKLINKVSVVDVLKRGDQVVGAAGFNIIDGRFHIFKAKATVLANGSCNYKLKRMWAAGSGDGIAAAYQAGAEMRNAEFGNLYDTLVMNNYDTGLILMDYLFNAKGENITQRYMPGPVPDIDIGLILGIEKEIMEGRGPIYLDIPPEALAAALAGMGKWHRPKLADWYSRAEPKVAKYGPPPSPKPEVTVGLTGELSPIKVNHDMKTTLEGLWAIGDTSYAGAAWLGAVPCPPGRLRGSGLMNALLTALRGASSAVRYAAESKAVEPDAAQVKDLKEKIMAPMQRDKGYEPADAASEIQNVMAPIKYNLRRSKDRLEEALSKVMEIQQRLPELYAKDHHGLASCHEVKSMAVCAEMTYRAALMRTESRGWHYREDYPERDDKNWLKWVIIRKEDDKMKLWTEPVPIEKYKLKP